MQNNNSACSFCSLPCSFFIVCEKIAAYIFKDGIIHPLKSKDSLKFALGMTLNHVIEKVNPWWKHSYKVFRKQYGCDPFIDIYPFPTLIQLTEFIGGVQHCVTVVGKSIFDRNNILSLPFACDDLEYCWNNFDIFLMNVLKGVLKILGFSYHKKVSVFFAIKKTEIMFDVINMI